MDSPNCIIEKWFVDAFKTVFLGGLKWQNKGSGRKKSPAYRKTRYNNISLTLTTIYRFIMITREINIVYLLGFKVFFRQPG
jgi:hypothetical protein